jgi:3-hydroxy-3-methylglutaryl CoA synthase/uncharacterized OB-fold protein
MTVLERLGVHVPRWRLDRQELAGSWSARSGPGARAVANFDEDPLTMGVEAALAAFGDDLAAAADIDAVLFATTTPVFTEKQHAAVIATALHIPAALCLDVTGSLRAGLDAVRTASALVEAGTARRVLVVAADRRDLTPGSPHERLSGDAGAAVVIGPDPEPAASDSPGPIAGLAGAVTISDPAAGHWRSPGDPCTRTADDRFVTTELLTPWLSDAIQAAGGDADAVAVAAPMPRVERGLGFPVAGFPELDGQVGYTGVAHPFLQLALQLAERAAGERVVLAAAGDGATALLVTVERPDGGPAGGLRDALARRRPLPVGMYQRMRGQLPTEPVDPYTSEMLLRREQSTGLELRGCRCAKCGRAHYPSRRICLGCHTPDLMEPLELPRTGTLFTHTVEHLFPVPTNELVMGVVQLGEVRLYTQVTDTEPGECAPGRPVRLVLRRLHDGGGLPHYFWKAVVINEVVA